VSPEFRNAIPEGTMVDITTVAGTISAAVGALKEILKLAEKAGSKELNNQVMGLQQSLLTINTQLTELATENHALRQRISEFERIADIEKEMKYEENVFLRVRGDKRIEGPLCPNCWDNTPRKYVHLTRNGPGDYYCGVCKAAGFRTAEYKSPSPQFIGVPSRFRDQEF
jgi:hypothetical protein